MSATIANLVTTTVNGQFKLRPTTDSFTLVVSYNKLVIFNQTLQNNESLFKIVVDQVLTVVAECAANFSIQSQTAVCNQSISIKATTDKVHVTAQNYSRYDLQVPAFAGFENV